MIPIQLIWLHGPLTGLAKISVASYLRHGMHPHIWTYGDSQDAGDVLWRDANELAPPNLIEKFRFYNGQMALGCDYLAWRASRVCGGWVGHLDVTLLKPLKDLHHNDYVFGPHHRDGCVSMALWKAPAYSVLAQGALSSITVPVTHWYSCMDVFGVAVSRCGLTGHTNHTLINNDSDEQPGLKMCRSGSTLPRAWENLHAIHWMASGLIRHEIIQPDSFLGSLR